MHNKIIQFIILNLLLRMKFLVLTNTKASLNMFVYTEIEMCLE